MMSLRFQEMVSIWINVAALSKSFVMMLKEQLVCEGSRDRWWAPFPNQNPANFGRDKC